MDPQSASDKRWDSMWKNCTSLQEAVYGLECCMNRMLTECNLSMTTKAWTRKVCREVRLVLKVWEAMLVHYLPRPRPVGTLIFNSPDPLTKSRTVIRGTEGESLFHGIEARLSECMGSFLDMFPPPTKSEKDLLRTKRDEEARLLSAFADLALLYLYLVGLIDRGGTRTYSSGSLLFSSTFLSIVLVLAFYLWFKSRAAPRRGYCRGGQTTIEARYKPRGASGNFSLGACADHVEAGIKHEIAAFYYGQHIGLLAFEDLSCPFTIPPTPSVPANLDAVGKRRWVKTQVRKVYEDVIRFRKDIAVLQALPDGPEAMIHFPHFPAAETQPVGDNHVAEAATTVPVMPDGRRDHESTGPGTTPVSAVINAVHGTSTEVAVRGLSNGAAADDIRQSNSCEVSPTLSASRKSPGNNLVALHSRQLSAPLAGALNVDQPWNSTLDLPPVALRLFTCLEQLIEEKDRRLAEYDRRLAEKDSLNEEQARVFAELKREVERLTRISQH